MRRDFFLSIHFHILFICYSIILHIKRICLSLYMYFFRKKDPTRPTNFNIKVMHWINALAILLFIAGITWKLIQWFIIK
ncbi:MAG: DUF6728 family protein [Bacteroidota bacterium]